MSKTSAKRTPMVRHHYNKLYFRLFLFIETAGLYFLYRIEGAEQSFLQTYPLWLLALWLLFAAETLRRFFPNKAESMGCQKQFAASYRPFPEALLPEPEKVAGKLKKEDRSRVGTALIWCLLNLFFGLCYLVGWFDQGILILLSLFYSVCDVFCILFYCPLQNWFLHNRCCTVCRIYNWDYAMMFTPLLFLGGLFPLSLFALGFLLLLKWELTYHKYPERFFPETNASLSCIHCSEKLCQQKKLH